MQAHRASRLPPCVSPFPEVPVALSTLIRFFIVLAILITLAALSGLIIP
jgi:hypothetical protein